MATKMNENGVSTCKAGEKYEKFQMTVSGKATQLCPFWPRRIIPFG